MPPAPGSLPDLALPTEPLSTREVRYPEIEAAHRASSLTTGQEVVAWRQAGGRASQARPPDISDGPIEDVIRRRRSSRRFERQPITRAQLERVLEAAMSPIPGDAFEPLPVEPFLIVNAVEGLEPGLYGPELGLDPGRPGPAGGGRACARPGARRRGRGERLLPVRPLRSLRAPRRAWVPGRPDGWRHRRRVTGARGYGTRAGHDWPDLLRRRSNRVLRARVGRPAGHVPGGRRPQPVVRPTPGGGHHVVIVIATRGNTAPNATPETMVTCHSALGASRTRMARAAGLSASRGRSAHGVALDPSAGIPALRPRVPRRSRGPNSAERSAGPISAEGSGRAGRRGPAPPPGRMRGQSVRRRGP